MFLPLIGKCFLLKKEKKKKQGFYGTMQSWLFFRLCGMKKTKKSLIIKIGKMLHTYGIIPSGHLLLLNLKTFLSFLFCLIGMFLYLKRYAFLVSWCFQVLGFFFFIFVVFLSVLFRTSLPYFCGFVVPPILVHISYSLIYNLLFLSKRKNYHSFSKLHQGHFSNINQSN